MERLQSTTGGRPIKDEDLTKYLQSFDIWEGYLNEIDTGDPVILYGCVVSGGGPYNFSSGVIYLDGSICLFDAIIGNAASFVEVSRDEVESDPREYKDLVTKNTLNTIKAILDPGSGNFIQSSSLRLFDLNPSKSQVDDNTAKIAGVNNVFVNIGAWDMTTLTAVLVTHGITDITKIRGVSVMIVPDPASALDGNVYFLDSVTLAGFVLNGGWGGVTPTQLSLFMNSVGFFNAASFSGGGNRGVIKFEIID